MTDDYRAYYSGQDAARYGGSDHAFMPPRSPELPSARVANDLRARIQAGEWASGEALPPVGDLAAHYQASRTTISKALRVLEADGLVTVVPRWGVFRA